MSQNDLESLNQLSNDGKRMEESTLSEHMEIIDVMMKEASSDLEMNQNQERNLPIVESHRTNKRTILKGKSNHSKKRIRTMKSSQILDQVSTSKENDCYGWWTKSCEEMSNRLWSPIKTDFADLPLNSLNGYVVKTEQHSWSKIKKYLPQRRNCQKILWPSYMSSLAGTMECEDTDQIITKTIKCQKIRLKPSLMQAQVLRKWMKGARDTYNMALRLLKHKKAKPNKLLKKMVVTSRVEDNAKVRIMKETPSAIRSRAVLDLLDAFKTAKAGFKARKKGKPSRWSKKGRRRRRKDGKKDLYSMSNTSLKD